MESFKYKSTPRVLNTAASLILFLIFTVCMLVIIGSGAGIYSRINSGYQATYGSSATIKYISNKIRAADECEINDDGTGIVLKNGNIITVIYSGNDGLYEKSQSAENEIYATGGNLVVEAASMKISLNDELYEISVTCGGNSSSVLLRKGETQ